MATEEPLLQRERAGTTGDMTVRPAALRVVGGDHVGRLDEGPFQVLVALRAHLAVVGLPPAGADAGGGAAVAGNWAAEGKRLIVPTSRSMTMARISPTPGTFFSSCMGGEGDLRADAILQGDDLNAKGVQ